MSVPACDASLSRWLWERLHYSDPVHTLHHLVMDDECTLLVIGDASNGAYEWVLIGKQEIRYSDCGYGDCTIALRDGLIVYHGSPDRPITVMTPVRLPDSVRLA